MEDYTWSSPAYSWPHDRSRWARNLHLAFLSDISPLFLLLFDRTHVKKEQRWNMTKYKISADTFCCFKKLNSCYKMSTAKLYFSVHMIVFFWIPLLLDHNSKMKFVLKHHNICLQISPVPPLSPSGALRRGNVSPFR